MNVVLFVLEVYLRCGFISWMHFPMPFVSFSENSLASLVQHCPPKNKKTHTNILFYELRRFLDGRVLRL